AEYSRAWVWKSFTRGYNPILMEMHQTNPMGDLRNGFISARDAMGYTLSYAKKMDLASMKPDNDLSSTKYCLSNPGLEYLVYQPNEGSFTVNLISGNYDYEWFNPTAGLVSDKGTLEILDASSEEFDPPYSDAVLYLKLTDKD
ncbi:MAG: hypothetical protein QG588_1751, partial [Candidatus Poribacteria bacterium]|nr:hypothetical protein [Candidatus Poribacteria bacterium]